MNNDNYHARITRKLTEAFQPSVLDVTDDSAKHKGHAGHNPLGETHFSVLIVSSAFETMSKIARHRAIYQVLADEIKERVHALSLQSLTPHEYNHRLNTKDT